MEPESQQQQSPVIHHRATVEDLLGLSVEGWKDIAAMSEAQLEVYLKDITVLEPKSDIEVGQLRGAKEVKPPKVPKVSKALAEIESYEDSDNPIKSQKKSKKKTGWMPSVDDLMKELDL